MDVSLSWLKAYIPDLDVTPQEYMDAMTMSGTKAEGYTLLDKNLEKIVVGKILSVEKHPHADKLKVCQTDVGGDVITLVTGAPNIISESVGRMIPVVLAGGKVAGGHDGGAMPEDGVSIEAGELRGVLSDGMMCSIEELGSSRDMYPEAPESGIYIFPEEKELKPGDDAVAALGLHDVRFEHEITSNRVDCYSIIGIAREAAATFNKKLQKPEPVAAGTGNVHDYAAVEVVDKDLCKRYCARVIKNVKIEPSPEWMQRHLASIGHRPINNLVDITNYVMEEYGQPMHAFDLDNVAGNKIIVKRAEDGQQFQSLDGQMHTLDSEVLTINDAEKAVGLAGIMGGENSKITDTVKTVLFESAAFDGTNNRLAAKRLGMRTDASAKYEKGLDPINCEEAINRACELVEVLGCGEVVAGMIDVHDTLPEERHIPFRPDKINKLLGTGIPAETMLSYFPALEFRYDEEANEVIVPTFRQDMEGEADLAEEVARFYGYDNIPSTLPGNASCGKMPLKLRAQGVISDVAEYAGFSQGMTYSFEGTKVYEKLTLPKNHELRKAIVISNPLGEDFSNMRTSLLNGMLSSLGTNYSRRNKNIRLYEISNIYLPKQLPLTELPYEPTQCILGLYGDGDFFELKGVIESMLYKLGMPKRVHYRAGAGRCYFHPGRQAEILYDDCNIGYMGEVHPTVSRNYGIGDRTYVANLDITSILPYVTFDRHYEGLTKYPAVLRDISLAMEKKITAGEVEKLIEKECGSLLEDYRLFDIYEGDQIQAGYKSLAYTLTFRSSERTLEDKEVNILLEKLLQKLKEMDVLLRG